MKVSYYLNTGRGKNLYCRITDGSERITFSLGYSILEEKWNAKKEQVPDDDEYYFTLNDFKQHLKRRYHELKSEGRDNILNILKIEAVDLVDKEGIVGIARRMFDQENAKHLIPSYDSFVQAFEKHSGFKKGKYQVQTVGHVIHFHTEGMVYEIDTYEGMTSFLRDITDRRSYDEIVTMTDEQIWDQIYSDPGIEKRIFLPVFLKEWERYWDTKYEEVKSSVGRTDHLDKHYEKSWRTFQVAMECFDTSVDFIKLCDELDQFVLLPAAVLAMLSTYDTDTCFSEYCEFLFSQDEWESISIPELSDDDYDSEVEVFYIRET